MAAPGLRCCVKAFSSCGKQGLPSSWAVASQCCEALESNAYYTIGLTSVYFHLLILKLGLFNQNYEVHMKIK